jgi:cytochrome b subunit of formate dehydrogenase
MTTFTFLLCGLALVYASKPRRAKSMMWVPFIYFYWGLQAFISFYAAMLIMLRRPRSWNKTVKTGAVNEAYVLQACA